MAQVPYTIKSIFNSMGIGYMRVGGHQPVYKMTRFGQPDPEAEKGDVEVLENGLINYEVGVQFSVNLQGNPQLRGKDWKMVVAVTLSDDYACFLWRPATNEEQATGKMGVVVSQEWNIPDFALRDVMDRLYLAAVEEYQGGFFRI